MGLRDLPNLITVLRMVLVGPATWLILEQRFGLALLLFGVAAFTDAVDGFLAKHFGWTSKLGGILDPLADKLLVMASFLALAWVGALPVWLVLLVVARDIIILAGAISYYFLVQQFQAAPTLTSKLNTLAQLMLVLVVVLDRGVIDVPELAVTGLIAITALTTVASGANYVWIWGRDAWNHFVDGRRVS
jgi:cardiolipin synthase